VPRDGWDKNSPSPTPLIYIFSRQQDSLYALNHRFLFICVSEYIALPPPSSYAVSPSLPLGSVAVELWYNVQNTIGSISFTCNWEKSKVFAVSQSCIVVVVVVVVVVVEWAPGWRQEGRVAHQLPQETQDPPVQSSPGLCITPPHHLPSPNPSTNLCVCTSCHY